MTGKADRDAAVLAIARLTASAVGASYAEPVESARRVADALGGDASALMALAVDAMRKDELEETKAWARTQGKDESGALGAFAKALGGALF